MKSRRKNRWKAEELCGAAERGELARMDGETEREYETFLVFCKVGAAGSFASVGTAVGMTRSGVARMSRRRRWIERVEQWWGERTEKAAAETKAVIPAVAAAPADRPREEEIKEAEWTMHTECLEAGREALERWKTSERVPMLSEVTKLLELASRLGRLAAGLPPENADPDAKESAPAIRIDLGAALMRAYGPAEIIDVRSTDAASEEDPERKNSQ